MIEAVSSSTARACTYDYTYAEVRSDIDGDSMPYMIDSRSESSSQDSEEGDYSEHGYYLKERLIDQECATGEYPNVDTDWFGTGSLGDEQPPAYVSVGMSPFSVLSLTPGDARRADKEMTARAPNKRARTSLDIDDL